MSLLVNGLLVLIIEQLLIVILLVGTSTIIAINWVHYCYTLCQCLAVACVLTGYPQVKIVNHPDNGDSFVFL